MDWDSLKGGDHPKDRSQVHFLYGEQFDAQRSAHTLASLTQNFSLSWIVTAVEGLTIVLLSLACGAGYHYFEYGRFGNALVFLSTGAVVALLYCTAIRSIVGSTASRLGVLSYIYIMWTGIFLVLSFFAFSIKASEDLSRGAILSFYFVGFIGAATARLSIPRLLGRFHGLATRHCIVIGAAGSTQNANIVRLLQVGGHASASLFTLESQISETGWSENLALTMRQVMQQVRVDKNGEIYVAASGFKPDRLHALLGALQTVPQAVRLVPESDVEQLLNFPIRRVGRTCVVELQRAPLSASQRVIKRGLDLSIAVPLLIFVGPIMAVIAVIVKLDSPGPVFFSQTRHGAWGTPFRILKFRSMNVMEDGTTIVQASRGDLRVTRVGRMLRKTSLDELPQLINVLKGEMSLVGPRPHAVAHDKLYSGLIENYQLRQLVKPGITGWAQVNGLRGETKTVEAMRKRIQYDLWYAKNASPLLDLIVLARTAIVLFGRPEAY